MKLKSTSNNKALSYIYTVSIQNTFITENTEGVNKK